MERPTLRDRHLWWIVTIDRICWHGCVECGTHAAVFAVQGRYISLCPKCVSKRIAALRERRREIPDWLQHLDVEARHELRAQERREAQALTVSWTDLVPCAHCGKIVRLKDVRYPANEGESVRYPHCQICYEMVSGRVSADG